MLTQGRCPGKEAFSVLDFSHREMGLKQAAAARRTFPIERCAFTEALAWSEPSSLLLPQQGFSRVKEEELRESWCLLGFAFPGSIFTSWVHHARPNYVDTATTLQLRA